MKKMLIFLMFLVSCQPAFAWQNITQEAPYQYKFTSSGTVTTVKSSAGLLHTLVVTGGTTSPVDIYDGALITSQIMYSFTTTNTLQTYIFDVNFSSGCTVVTNGNLKFTVSYK